MKDIIIYFGIVFFERKNAMCQRVNAIAKSVEDSGYQMIIIGTNKDVGIGEYRKVSENQYEINYPTNKVEWIHSVLSAKKLFEIIQEIGEERVRTVIMADYRFLPMLKIKHFCERKNIHYVIDVMDWFQRGDSLESRIKYWDNIFRIKYLYPRVKRKICICSNFQKLFGLSEYTVVIPGTIIPDEEKWNLKKIYRQDSAISLVFAGEPGVHCEKEKIDWIINAIAELKAWDKIQVHLLGVEKELFEKNNPKVAKNIKDNVCFYGRKTHEECIQVIGNSDFSLIIREKNKLSEYGFSTKISESFGCGIPVITTDTSDNKEYVLDKKNGFVTECTYSAVKKCLRELLNIDPKEILKMKENVANDNPLVYSKFTDELRKVL